VRGLRYGTLVSRESSGQPASTVQYFVAGCKVRDTLCRTLWHGAKYEILYVVLCGRKQSTTYYFMSYLLWHCAKYDILYVVLCGRKQSTTYFMSYFVAGCKVRHTLCPPWQLSSTLCREPGTLYLGPNPSFTADVNTGLPGIGSAGTAKHSIHILK
jgi:hypothetical protein